LGPDEELAAERALLEQARTALARGKPADALTLLARHAQTFPTGRLVEEREALVILSLEANHQTESARKMAAEFRQRHPHSMLLRAIDTALSPKP
jgi:outer membrane protein assembly factor BamD (BamD/ComL family)